LTPETARRLSVTIWPILDLGWGTVEEVPLCVGPVPTSAPSTRSAQPARKASGWLERFFA
jgi:hypothetical protein